MSSHHIVRENQEPALIIEDFFAIDIESIGQILEWSPRIITDLDNLDFLIAEGIKVDMIYSHHMHTPQEEIKFIEPQSEFLNDTLAYLIKHNYKAVNILAKQASPLLLSYADKIDIVTFVSSKRYIAIKNRFQKWKVKGERLFIDVSRVKSLNNLSYKTDDIFEVEHDGFITIEFNSDHFTFIAEEL